MSKTFNTPQTEIELIETAIEEASTAYQDGNTPDDERINRLSDKLYDDLYGYRDRQPERLLDRPVLHNLYDIFKQLKFGRTAADQTFLGECMDGLKEPKE